MQETVCDLASNLHTSMQSGTYSIEERKIKPQGKLTCVFRECSKFRAIWFSKARADQSFSLQSIAGEDSRGMLLYRGKLFNRDSWTWQPPRIIWMQGRRAKEEPNLGNSKACIQKEVLRYGQLKTIIITKCDCGGPILRDHNGYMYCKDCGLIYDEVIWLDSNSGT